MLNFRLPELSDKQIIRSYIREHLEHGEHSISASIHLMDMKFDDWVYYVHSLQQEGPEGWGRSHLLLCFDEDRLVGLMNVRYEMREDMRDIFGNIGYGVRPTERRKGYATQMLAHGLNLCEEKGLDTAILGCIEENIASQKTMIRNGGQLIRYGSGYKPDKVNLYYKFTLNKPEAQPEEWDLYDRFKVRTNKTHIRGVWPIPDGYYHLIVHAWIRNSEGKYLISQRAATRPSYPLMYETVGGSVVKGEDSLTSVLREIKEEVGLTLSPGDGKLVRSQIRDAIGDLQCRDIVDDWLFIYDGPVDLNDSTTDEVTQIQWMSVQEIRNLFDKGLFVPTMKYFFTDIDTVK